jgi:hypothetical protein
MQYFITVFEADEAGTPYTAPVPEGDAEYLRRATATLRPLTAEEYVSGPLVILHTMAKYSYVLDGSEVFWCVEWDPGLIVIRLSPDGTLQWTALRSPVPNFGGRDATEAEMEEFDEDADNPQYNLIFDPWDAQFDAEEREWKSFVLASQDEITQFEAAIAHANQFGEVNKALPAGDRRAWSDRCVKNLEDWAGEGIRLK